MVPNEAVKEGDDSTTVTVLDRGEQVPRKVEVGLVGRDYTEIVNGLKQGQKIVTAVIQTSTTTTPGFGPGGPMGGPMGGGMRR